MDLSKRTVVEGATAMPPLLTALITRMQQVPLLQHFQPNEANAIDYRKSLGHWLKPHVDDRSAAGFSMTCDGFKVELTLNAGATYSAMYFELSFGFISLLSCCRLELPHSMTSIKKLCCSAPVSLVTLVPAVIAIDTRFLQSCRLMHTASIACNFWVSSAGGIPRQH